MRKLGLNMLIIVRPALIAGACVRTCVYLPLRSIGISAFCVFVLMHYVPVNNFSVVSGRFHDFLCWNSTKQRIKHRSLTLICFLYLYTLYVVEGRTVTPLLHKLFLGEFHRYHSGYNLVRIPFE